MSKCIKGSSGSSKILSVSSGLSYLDPEHGDHISIIKKNVNAASSLFRFLKILTRLKASNFGARPEPKTKNLQGCN